MAMIPKRPKKFDCVEMKRQAQRRIYEEIKELSSEEEMAYFRRGAEDGPLADWWSKVRATKTVAKSS